MESIELKIIEMLKIIFDDFDGAINKELKKDDVEQWDSLASAQIIMGIEREFNRFFTDEELTSIKSVGDLIHLVSNVE